MHVIIVGVITSTHPSIQLSVVICRIDLSVAFEGADDDLVGAVGQMRKLYKINEGMFNIDMF